MTTASSAQLRTLDQPTAAARRPSVLDLLIAVTVRDIRVRYHGTFLFYFWWIARPLALGVVMYFALGHVLQLDIPNHAVFLLTALFPWFWFQNAVHGSTGAFVGNTGLLKKVRFPRAILPLSIVLGSAFEFAVSLPVLIGIILFTGIDPSWTWSIGIPVLFIVQLALLSGLALLIAPINVFFRDLAPALTAIMTVLFYVTPIIYPLDRAPERAQTLLQLNPLVPLIEAWRNLLMFGDMPGLSLWPALIAVAVVLSLGAFTLHKLDASIVDAI